MISIFFVFVLINVYFVQKKKLSSYLSFPSLYKKKMAKSNFDPCRVINSYLSTGTFNDFHVARGDLHQRFYVTACFHFLSAISKPHE